MPFTDLNIEPVSFASDHFDVVIVVAGAAGILLDIELSRRQKKILLLESGHFTEDEERQKLNTVVQTGKTLTNAVWGRKRAIGGTTIAWGGQSLPFDRMDFERRDWIANSGWPFSYDELAGYYPLANRFMKVDELDYEEDIFRLLKMKRPGFDKGLLFLFSSRRRHTR